MRPSPLLSFLFLLTGFLATQQSTFSVHAHTLQYPIASQLPLIARVDTPYAWSISPKTFLDTPPQNLTATRLPTWLSFDGATLTLSGTPSASDEGTAEVEIAAGGGEGAEMLTKDVFTVCVTRFPPPTLVIPLADQIRQDNPSLASVFTLHDHSALSTGARGGRPAVRVPPNWSFSVGLQGGTYKPAQVADVRDVPAGQTAGDLFYYALQEDGTPLPDWIKFNPQEMTFDGYTRLPPVQDPEVVSVVLIATDQKGYSAYHDPFDIIVASQELSANSPEVVVPINVTQGEPVFFDLRRLWAGDGVFSVLLNNGSLSVENITGFSVDPTGSGLGWLEYNSSDFRLGGTAPKIASEDGIPLGLTLSAFNQSLPLNASIRVLPSYFSELVFEPTYVSPGSEFSYDLKEHLSNSPSFDGHDVNLTVFYNPNTTSSFLQFDSSSRTLSGTVPPDVSIPSSNITFIAYDDTTRATSHATLPLSFRVGSTNTSASASETSPGRKRTLILALAITFGIIGGIALLFCVLACCRKCFAVPDSAVDPYSRKEKAAYVIAPDPENQHSYGGWVEKLGLGLGSRWRGGSDVGVSSDAARSHSPALATYSARSGAPSSDASAVGQYTGLGIGFTPQPKMVRKKAFFQGVKNVVRKISESVASTSLRNRKEISKPVLMLTRDSADTLEELQRAAGIAGTGNSFGGENSFRSTNVVADDSTGFSVGMNSTPTSSTTPTGAQSEKSIPRRRADFGPPVLGRTLGNVTTPSTMATDAGTHPSSAVASKYAASTPNTKRSSKRQSTDTQRTQSSGDLDRDVEEAVITTASRAASVRSTHSGYSYNPSVRDSMARPRLVQFTSAKGVPVPVPNLSVANPSASAGKRRVSQVADMVEANDALLSEGMRYVRAFGDGNGDKVKGNGAPVASTSKRSSRSVGRGGNGKISPTATSNGSSSHTPLSTQSSYVYPSPSASFDSDLNYRGSLVMSRILVRVGESFSFKLPVNANVPPPLPNSVPAGPSKYNLTARQLHGDNLPRYLSYVQVPSRSSRASQRVEVEFWGTPGMKDVGEVLIGVYDERGECVGKLAIEAVTRS